MAKKYRLNAQGLSRKDIGFMTTLVAEPGRTFVSIDLCLPPETEYLTTRGWVPILNLLDTDLVWQVDRESLHGSFVKPTRVLKQMYTGDMISYSTVRGTLTSTKDHRLLAMGQYNHTRPDKRKLRMDFLAGHAIPSKAAHLTTFSLSTSTSPHTDQEIWISAMLQADGSLYKGQPNTYNIQVSKPRKRSKVTQLLGKSGTEYPAREGQNLATETWSYVKFKSTLLKDKNFELSNLGSDQVDVFVQALRFWDGSFINTNKKTGRFTWSTMVEQDADEVQAYLVRSGYEAKKSQAKNGIYILSIRKHGQIRMYSSRRKRFCDTTATPYSGMVGCVSVPSTYILVRQYGQTFVTGNCAGEPSVTANFSDDTNYRWATLDGVGKSPTYVNGVLMIDDIYLMTASASPMFSASIQEAFDRDWDGKTFAEQWLLDSEIIKNSLKKIRQISKILCLGIGYGMQPKKMVKQMYENGVQITLKEATDFFNAYWRLFDRVLKFSKQLSNQVKQDGFIINPFGYRMVCEPRLAFNYFIQSTVSGIIHVFLAKLMAAAPYCTYCLLIHDEVVMEVDDNMLDQLRYVQVS